MSEFLLIDAVLLFLLVATSVTAIMMRNLFATTMIMSSYSLLMSLVWLNLDALDVAITEAAVGAGIATILLIGAMVLVGSEEKRHPQTQWPALLVVALTTAALVYGTLDMPALGDPAAPPQTHVVPEYIAQTVEKAEGEPVAPHRAGRPGHAGERHDYFHGHVPNLVTSVIVDYRAYDTLFEVTVIFAAGISLILLLRGRLFRTTGAGR